MSEPKSDTLLWLVVFKDKCNEFCYFLRKKEWIKFEITFVLWYFILLIEMITFRIYSNRIAFLFSQNVFLPLKKSNQNSYKVLVFNISSPSLFHRQHSFSTITSLWVYKEGYSCYLLFYEINYPSITGHISTQHEAGYDSKVERRRNFINI